MPFKLKTGPVSKSALKHKCFLSPAGKTRDPQDLRLKTKVNSFVTVLGKKIKPFLNFRFRIIEILKDVQHPRFRHREGSCDRSATERGRASGCREGVAQGGRTKSTTSL